MVMNNRLKIFSIEYYRARLHHSLKERDRDLPSWVIFQRFLNNHIAAYITIIANHLSAPYKLCSARTG